MSKPSEYSSAVRPAVPIFEVAFKKGMWWSIPADMSQQMYENYRNNEDVGYTWDWGNSRYGSWAPEGEPTSINRYLIDFNRWEQRNLDNDRRLSQGTAFMSIHSCLVLNCLTSFNQTVTDG